MIVLGVFIIIVLVLVLFSVGLLIKGVLYLFNRFRGRQVLFATKGVRRSLLGMLIVLVLGITLIVITQLTAATPKIAKENSIAELRKVELNGRKEWISIRGENRSKIPHRLEAAILNLRISCHLLTEIVEIGRAFGGNRISVIRRFAIFS